MGGCASKPPKPNPYSIAGQIREEPLSPTADVVCQSKDAVGKKSTLFTFFTPSPARYFFSKESPALPPPSAPRSANSTPRRILKMPFPPPSPAKHIKAVLFRRHGRNNTATIPEGAEGDAAAAEADGAELDKSFGYSKQFTSKYEIGEEVGRGHFGYTCSAVAKNGHLKGQKVAVKVIPKDKVLC